MNEKEELEKLLEVMVKHFERFPECKECVRFERHILKVEHGDA
jgi:hypothetical protein